MIHEFDDRRIADIIQKVRLFLQFADDGVAVFFHILDKLLGGPPAEVIGHIDGK